MLDSSVVERVWKALMSESFVPEVEGGNSAGNVASRYGTMPWGNIDAHASRHTAPRHCVVDCVNDPDAEACPMRAVTYMQQMLFHGVKR